MHGCTGLELACGFWQLVGWSNKKKNKKQKKRQKKGKVHFNHQKMCQMKSSPEVTPPKHWQIEWAAAVSSTINRESKKAEFVFLRFFNLVTSTRLKPTRGGAEG